MIEQITIGQIATTLAFIVAMITSIGYLRSHLKGWIKVAVKDEFDVLSNKIDELQRCVNQTDLEKTKNFLVARLAEVEKGGSLDEIELERFWEQYEHYTKHGGNSYIEQKVQKLQREGKI